VLTEVDAERLAESLGLRDAAADIIPTADACGAARSEADAD